jgi:hypothetical protein
MPENIDTELIRNSPLRLASSLRSSDAIGELAEMVAASRTKSEI